MPIIASEYSPSGFVSVDSTPVRIDKSPEEIAHARAADRLPLSALYAMFGWDDAAFDRAKCYGFPPPLGRMTLRDSWQGLGESFWSRSAVEAWRDRVVTFARTLEAPPSTPQRIRRLIGAALVAIAAAAGH